jgi:hypothetical protein
MTEEQVERIAVSLERIAQLMENSQKRDVNFKRNQIKEANKSKKPAKQQRPAPTKEDK